jgi:SWI/SNF-related matrix-associated actin-dependent regulator 1 of chromatin subfamily A
MLQAEDRAHRIGQPSSVNCHYLVGEGTLDDYLYRKLERKFNTVSKVIDGWSGNL